MNNRSDTAATAEEQKSPHAYSFRRVLVYIAGNSLFVAAGIYGNLYGAAWAWNVFVFSFWTCVVFATLAALIDDVKAKVKKKGRTVPIGVDTALDVCISLGLASVGHFWMAGFWVWQITCVLAMHHEESEADSVSNAPSSDTASSNPKSCSGSATREATK